LSVLTVSTDILEDSRIENASNPTVRRASAPVFTFSKNEIDRMVSNSSADEHFRRKELRLC
jgi:hypothetical protein